MQPQLNPGCHPQMAPSDLSSFTSHCSLLCMHFTFQQHQKMPHFPEHPGVLNMVGHVFQPLTKRYNLDCRWQHLGHAKPLCVLRVCKQPVSGPLPVQFLLPGMSFPCHFVLKPLSPPGLVVSTLAGLGSAPLVQDVYVVSFCLHGAVNYIF